MRTRLYLINSYSKFNIKNINSSWIKEELKVTGYQRQG